MQKCPQQRAPLCSKNQAACATIAHSSKTSSVKHGREPGSGQLYAIIAIVIDEINVVANSEKSYIPRQVLLLWNLMGLDRGIWPTPDRRLGSIRIMTKPTSYGVRLTNRIHDDSDLVFDYPTYSRDNEIG
ncbi:hypothetical protein AG1IA_05411 [Rhizoctonia solani AG-1 IA]|uniref:Uncharacterized protein n=1 Tax=Thanatephorus cucumeris (strain AG1-IA) TaxID=983506 RepID=L8WRC1_THACA|nr:hypothetical protein AG1IA_05411 [Rhizoctonia solani AG-1 IA]